MYVLPRSGFANAFDKLLFLIQGIALKGLLAGMRFKYCGFIGDFNACGLLMAIINTEAEYFFTFPASLISFMGIF